MLPRYLVLDIDDTLTTHGHVQPATLAALQRAAKAGIDVILDTGRSAGWGAAMLQYLPAVSAAIVENGGAWFDLRLPRPHAHEVPVQFATAAPDRARLIAAQEAAAADLGWEFVPTADDPFRLTDHTVVRTLPGGTAGAALLQRLRQALADPRLEGPRPEGPSAPASPRSSSFPVELLASSVHLHFYSDDPARRRSKAAGLLALLARRGVPDPADEVRRLAVAVGDSGNDISLFHPGRFALAVGVRNIERYLPELGDHRPGHITRSAEGDGVIELIDDLLDGRFAAALPVSTDR